MPPLPDTHCTPLASLWGNNNDPFLHHKQHDLTAAKFSSISPVVVIPGGGANVGISRSNSAVYSLSGSLPASPDSEPEDDFQRRLFSSTPNSITTNNTQHINNYQPIHHQSSFSSSSGSPPPLSRSTTANSVFSNGSSSASGGSGIWSPSVFSASSHYDNQQHQQQQQRLFQSSQQQQQQQLQQQQLPSYNDCQFFNIDTDGGVTKDYPVRWAPPLEQQPQQYGLPMQQQQQQHHQYMDFNEYPGNTHSCDFSSSSGAAYPDRRISSFIKPARKQSEPLMRSVSAGALPSPPPSSLQQHLQHQQQVQQQQNQQNQQNQQQQGRLIVNSELYKTELCATFIRYGSCPYGKKCQFAHGDHDLKAVDRPPKWRSKPCQNWLRTGTCAYNERCCFRHDTVKPQ